MQQSELDIAAGFTGSLQQSELDPAAATA